MTGNETGRPVQGVLGEIAPHELGFTQSHEHASLDIREFVDETFHLDDLAQVGDDLKVARGNGLQTIVDAGTDGHRRDPRFLAELARYSDVQIIASTGYWRELAYPPYVAEESTEQIADRMISDIRVGIGGTDIRAGAIGEMGSESPGMSALEEKTFRAAAIAQAETDVPLMTHTAEGLDALRQLDLLTGYGVRPERILIGHVDCMDDVNMHSEIAAAGAFVGYDRVGLTLFQPDSLRVRLITEMIARGHGRQLIVSTDLATQKDMRSSGRPGYSYLIEEFLPLLRDAGVDEPTIQMLTVENPRRLLCGA
jgi:phosphotriesterase-related protein